MTERGGCCQWLIHRSVVTQWAVRGALQGSGSRGVPWSLWALALVLLSFLLHNWQGTEVGMGSPLSFPPWKPNTWRVQPLMDTAWIQHLHCHSKHYTLSQRNAVLRFITGIVVFLPLAGVVGRLFSLCLPGSDCPSCSLLQLRYAVYGIWGISSDSALMVNCKNLLSSWPLGSCCNLAVALF